MPDLEKSKLWLGDALRQHNPLILKFMIFGSVLGSTRANDVDVMLVASEWDIRETLKEMRRSFRIEFGLPLHIQPFHASQEDRIESFVKRAAPLLEVS